MSVTDLPIPVEQLHYADPAINVQECPIDGLINLVHYPTLGCPALTTGQQELRVLLSLPLGAQAETFTLTLSNRHGDGSRRALQVTSREAVSSGPDGSRHLWLIRSSLSAVPPAFYDLEVSGGQIHEIQWNAVRVFSKITGNEKVVLSGDSQYHVDNQSCLERFVERVNADPDIAWIALIGDACDNGVKSEWNLIRLAAGGITDSVTHYYAHEFIGVHKLLRQLRHPIIVVPGNHDGMSAYAGYQTGVKSDSYLGPDSANRVAYDGFHHYRRTFGPLYFHFDWGNCRYVVANSFELDRQQRLGFHAIVANWGGWMREEQLTWLQRTLEDAGQRGLSKVVLMHHDPRGGSCAKRLGNYSRVRAYDYVSRLAIVKSYLSYVARNGFADFQQEWMIPATLELEQHPVKNLLATLLKQHVFAVVMGHDNDNWVESYMPSSDLFEGQPPLRTYPLELSKDPGELRAVYEVADLLSEEDFEAAAARLSEFSPPERERIAAQAVLVLRHREGPPEVASFGGVSPLQRWNLLVEAPIHFVHVDDIGAYSYKDDSAMNKFGYVVAQLKDGTPSTLQGHHLGTLKPGVTTPLAQD